MGWWNLNYIERDKIMKIGKEKGGGILIGIVKKGEREVGRVWENKSGGR